MFRLDVISKCVFVFCFQPTPFTFKFLLSSYTGVVLNTIWIVTVVFTVITVPKLENLMFCLDVISKNVFVFYCKLTPFEFRL